jgi:hypothetical protein
VVIRALYPRLTSAQAASIVVPHGGAQAAAPASHDGTAAPPGRTAGSRQPH